MNFEKLKQYIPSLPVICISTFLLGIFFFCLYQQWIIIHFSWGTAPVLNVQKGLIEKKQITLFFFKDEQWHKETTDILWSENKAVSLQHIVSKWLSIGDEEEILHKKVTLLHATLGHSKTTAYLSFDRYPFDKEASTQEKYMIIKGLLKTVKESGIGITALQFLTHHKPIPDYHLDFSHPWPID